MRYASQGVDEGYVQHHNNGEYIGLEMVVVERRRQTVVFRLKLYIGQIMKIFYWHSSSSGSREKSYQFLNRFPTVTRSLLLFKIHG